MKVLLLSCSTGGGHNSCAHYIEDELKNQNIECIFYDFFDIVNGKAKDLSSKVYLKTLGNNGKMFSGFYKIGELYSKTKIKSPVYLINSLHKKKLFDFINENNYDLVITTHLFPALALTAINKDKNFKKINFIFVATDYEPCPFMEETKPDYFVMQKGLEERFVEKGIDKDKLLNFGIPVSSNFINNAKNIRQDYNINNEKVILIMLGSMGFGNVDESINLLLKENIKVIIVCGSNKALYEKLKEKNNNNLIVLGFVNNINDLIYSSDLVLSKPGGLSSTEIVSIRKPLIHVFPIPGIETYNATFFENYGMSKKCENNDELLKQINELLIQENADKLIECQKKLINNHSAKDLINFIKKTY